MRNPLRGVYPLTQSWEAHIRNAGAKLGGEDYDMKVGTRLPILDGVIEYVDEGTRTKASWYNAGLGNAVCYRRADGSGTVMGHLSGMDGRQALSGNSGKSTGPHVHVHDIDTDGRTRLRPFTTASQGGGGGGGRTNSMTTVYREADNMRHALAGDSPGTTANWIETAGDEALIAGWIAKHGPVVKLTADGFSEHRSWYQQALRIAGGAPGGSTTDPAPVVAAIKELGTLVAGLPAEIDRYADGRKQSN